MLSLPNAVCSVIARLRGAGYEAYAVGGCVRDMLRGVSPKDYDITTSARPEEVLRVFADHRCIPTGIKHGTVTVLSEGVPFEITTYRVDGDYADGRHPDSVCFTASFREDAARRDFTINAMGYAPEEGVIDHFGGRADLADGLIRAVGDPRRRFTEDALRILRAVRFAAVLGFDIEPATAAAIHEEKERLRLVSPERIREEWVKLLCGRDAARILREYVDVIAVFLPEVREAVGFDQHNPHHIYDVYEHTLRVVEATPDTPVLRLAAFFHDLGKPFCFSRDTDGTGHFYGHAAKSTEIAERALTALRFDNATRLRVVTLVRLHDTVPEPHTRQIARMRGKYGEETLFDLYRLMRADHAAQAPHLADERGALMDAAEEALRELISREPPLTAATLAIGGRDLAALGVPPGPQMGAMLRAALEEVIEGRLANQKEELLAFITARFGEKEPPHREIERKFLIRMPNTAALLTVHGATDSEILQTYLCAAPGETARVRRRTYADRTVYTHTVKRRVTAVTAEEAEREIDRAEYERLLQRADPRRTPVGKRRITLPCGRHTAEIDIYPFWSRQAILEVELSAEDEAFSLPRGIEVLREVTADPRYKNTHLAHTIPAEEV